MAGWSKQSAHVLKDNCKGVFDRSMMKASEGCVMTNSRGLWVREAASMIGLVVPVGAQLWSMFYGLKMTWEKEDVRYIMVECDCQKAVDQMNNPDPNFWLATLVDWIKDLQNEAWESCVIQYVPSPGNAAATSFANSKLNGPGGIKDLVDAPAFMASILASNIA